MITSRRLPLITLLLVCLAVFICVGIVVAASNETGTGKVTEYQKKLFGDEVLSIDIQVSDDDWQSLLDNAMNKEYIAGDLLINGVRFNDVGIRTKGNSSLTQLASTDGDRYSLQFKFDYYAKGQTCYGLDSFCVNNVLGDATYMKDYISYNIMNYIGVETPLVNYANVTVNGEDLGFYIALERYDKSFLDRAFGTSGGQLYNVKIQMGQRENFMDAANGQNDTMPQGQGMAPMQRPEATEQNGEREALAMGGVGFAGGFGGGVGGGSLLYTDDSITSYSAIFENSVFKKNTDSDKQRVIKAIQNLNEGTNLETYFDVDEILRYFAAHTVVVNLDSYISSMQQNYYIYERDGKISILPWDYGLAFGGFQSGSATDVVNFPIDTPVSGVSMEDRPLLSKLLEVPEYLEKYHEYLREIVEGYFNSGLFEETVMGLNAKISAYVEKDVSAFYTYEEYNKALSTFIELGVLRAQSIEGQLDGIIPSTTEGQAADKNALVDASHISLSELGSMGGGQGGRNGEMDFGGNGFGGAFEMPNFELIQKGMQILQESGGILTDEGKEKLIEAGLTEEQISMVTEMISGGFGGNGPVNGNMPQNDNTTGDTVSNTSQENGEQTSLMRQGMGMPGFPGTDAAIDEQYATHYALLLGVLMLLLLGSAIFVARSEKKY